MTTSEKVLNLLSSNKITKVELSSKLGISRPTLDKRIKDGNWKRLEKVYVNTLK